LTKQYGARPFPVVEEHRKLSTSLNGTSVTICALETNPAPARPVLLDIDTDFMTLPSVSIDVDGMPGTRPWMWPAELASTLRAYSWNPTMVTIAYSVDGGYTPIGWKWLGDALLLEWQDATPESVAIRTGFELLLEAAKESDSASASVADLLTLAASRLPLCGAPWYRLALIHLERADIAEARRCFDRAARIDPAHRGPFGCRGFALIGDGAFVGAAEEFDRLAALDPESAFVPLGLGRIAAHEKRWREAEAHLRRAIQLGPRLIDAYRHLGDVLIHLGRDQDALAAYGRSLKLALEGERSFEALAATETRDRPVRQEHHAYLHAELAAIDARAGRIPAAIAGLRLAIAAGDRRPKVSRALASLYARERRWDEAAAEAVRAISLALRSLRRSIGLRR
jgi:tetratricopeptide (TPR) repeat protein